MGDGQPHGTTAGTQWQRFHPLTPLMRGGIMTLGVITYLLSHVVDDVVGSDRDAGFDAVRSHLLLAAAAFAAVVLVVSLVSWVTWRISRFRLTPTSIELRTGLLFRQHRHVRLDRVQSVDLRRTLLARALGLAEVKVGAAGAGDSGVSLAYLSSVRAEQLRHEILLHAARVGAEVAPAPPRGPGRAAVLPQEPIDGAVVPTDGGAAPVPGAPAPVLPAREAPPLIRIPNVRLVQAELATGTTLFLVLLVPAMLWALLTGRGAWVAGLVPALLATGPAKVGAITKNANFTLYPDAGRLRVDRGLTDLASSSVPLRRIQAVEISQPMLWRFFGWWKVRANVAGVRGGEGKEGGSDVLLPCGTVDEALSVLRAALPAADLALARRALAQQRDTAFLGPPPSARLFDPFTWQLTGYALDSHDLVIRQGRVCREVTWVPVQRIQSLLLEQGPLERRRDLATVRVISVPGPVRPVVPHLSTAVAEELAGRRLRFGAPPAGLVQQVGGAESPTLGLSTEGKDVT